MMANPLLRIARPPLTCRASPGQRDLEPRPAQHGPLRDPRSHCLDKSNFWDGALKEVNPVPSVFTVPTSRRSFDGRPPSRPSPCHRACSTSSWVLACLASCLSSLSYALVSPSPNEKRGISPTAAPHLTVTASLAGAAAYQCRSSSPLTMLSGVPNTAQYPSQVSPPPPPTTHTSNELKLTSQCR